VLFVAIPAVALSLVSIAAFFGKWVWWLDVLANFRVQYVVALLPLGVAVALSKWKKTGLGVLLAAAVNLVVLLPLFVGSPGASDPAAPTVRVMSFNLLSTNTSYSEVFAYIDETEPDIVFLHEASLPWETAAQSAATGYQVVIPRSEDIIFGTLVLVRGDEVDARSYGFGIAQVRAVEVTFRPAGWSEPVRVLGTHPLAPTNSTRAGLRDAQLGFAAGWAERADGAAVITGDFNATPWSWPFRHMMATAGLHNSQVGFGLQASFPATSSLVFRVPIDHLLHNDRLRVRNRQLGPPLGSDHFPLVVDLELLP
jgi:endonuclease/exonuclease/phosphatase (EEP) superfamily protein YafD